MIGNASSIKQKHVIIKSSRLMAFLLSCIVTHTEDSKPHGSFFLQPELAHGVIFEKSILHAPKGAPIFATRCENHACPRVINIATAAAPMPRNASHTSTSENQLL